MKKIIVKVISVAALAGIFACAYGQSVRAAAPTITGVSPAYGPVAGGNDVTIIGTGFQGMKKVKKVFTGTGSRHACALTIDDRLYCWGRNNFGQIGDGTTEARSAPVDITNSGSLQGKTVKTVSMGVWHTCALTTDNSMHCWGGNGSGQVGNGGSTTVTSPTSVTVLDSVTAAVEYIGIGQLHTCVRTSDNKAYCWGSNTLGQLGDGTGVSNSNAVDITSSGLLAGKSIKTLVTGRSYNCAITTEERLYCWGENYQGQIGDGTTVNRLAPVESTNSGSLNGKTIRSLFGGDSHLCAVTTDDAIHCWGMNVFGQIGNGVMNDRSAVPVDISSNGSLTGKVVSGVYGGQHHTCAVATDDTVHCWGWNAKGQLGNGGTTSISTPALIDKKGSLIDATIRQFAVSGVTTYAVTTDDRLHAWGYNAEGSIGDGARTDRSEPYDISPHFSPGDVVKVLFGSHEIEAKVLSATKIQLTAPANTAGAVDVSVMDTSGTVKRIAGYVYIEASDTTADYDKDGVTDKDELAGPGGGDLNADGTPDFMQKTVTPFTNGVTSTKMGMSVSGCSVAKSVAMSNGTHVNNDAGYQYPIGMVDYELACSANGASADVVVYLDKVYDTTKWKLRKYNKATKKYSDISTQVTFGVTTGDTPVTTISYQVIDGGELDEDGIANGIIIDPAGPAVAIEVATAEEQPVPAPVATTASTTTPEQPVLAKTGGSLVIAGGSTAATIAFGAYLLIKRLRMARR